VEFICQAGDDSQKNNLVVFAALILKKQFLDNRPEEEGMW
jgi:hypothetical protein